MFPQDIAGAERQVALPAHSGGFKRAFQLVRHTCLVSMAVLVNYVVVGVAWVLARFTRIELEDLDNRHE